MKNNVGNSVVYKQKSSTTSIMFKFTKGKFECKNLNVNKTNGCYTYTFFYNYKFIFM